MAKTNKLLIIVSNAPEFQKVGYRTGLWLSELTHFWNVAEESGYSMDIASPSGGFVPLDPESLIMTELGEAIGMNGAVSKRYEDRSYMNLLDNSLNVADADVDAYDAIYLTGGHGVMFDFPNSTVLSDLIARFYEDGKIVSAVCHGPCGLLEVKLRNGNYLIANRNVTGFSWKEEVVAKRDKAVPFSLEDELQKRGAKYSKAVVPFGTHVVEDDRLITGQNPGSAEAVANAVVRALQMAQAA